MAELFTENGTWEWPEGERLVKGREALREYFGSRPADRLSRRLMSNVLVTVALSGMDQAWAVRPSVATASRRNVSTIDE